MMESSSTVSSTGESSGADNDRAKAEDQLNREEEDDDERRSQRGSMLGVPDGSSLSVSSRGTQTPFVQENHSACSCLKQVRHVFTYNRETFIFASRVAVSMTIASLFVLLFPPTDPYPNAIWVVTTAAVVSWVDDLNTASAVQKMYERCLGTLVGAAIGVILGFIGFAASSNDIHQAAFLGVLFAITSFIVPYVCDRTGFRASYAAKICLITVGVVSLSFLTPSPDGSPDWQLGTSRAGNIVLGSFVGSFSLLLWPKSTKNYVQDKVIAEMRFAGETANKVLHLAYDVFAHKQTPPHWTVCQRSEHLADEAFKSYDTAIKGWKSCVGLLPKLRYDPLYRVASKQAREEFEERMRQCTHRCFRIYTNLLLMDAIIRSGVNHDLYPEAIQVLKDAGSDIQDVLDLSKDSAIREAAADRLITDFLVQIRVCRAHLRKETDQLNEDSINHHMRRSLSRFSISPLQCLEQTEQVALFFQLAEHLIVRTTQLHHFYNETSSVES